MSNQSLADKYRAQLLRVYGICTEDMSSRIDAMSEEKLRRDLENIKAYPDKVKEPRNYWSSKRGGVVYDNDWVLIKEMR